MNTQHTEKRLAKHQVKNLVVSCIDFRFRGDMHQALQDAFGIDDFDEIKLAGGGGNLATLGRGERCKMVLDDIGLALKAHGVENVYLINHQNCGAYALSGSAFPKEITDEEREYHRDELASAAAMVKELYPNVNVVTSWAHVHPETDEIILK